MSEETILSTIQKRFFSLASFILIGTIFLFSTICMMNTYVKENNKKIQKIEHFIENEKQVQDNIKTVGLKHFNKIDSMFDKNKFSLACCPSSYSTDKGCLCVDKDTKKTMDTRGNNTNIDTKTDCY